MSDTTLGLFFLLVAGIMNASFTLPMKFTRTWAWENTWLAWSIFALILLPPIVTWLTVPQLTQVYHDAGTGPTVLAATFGLGWGIAQVFFGLAVESIGIALTFSIVLGISAAVGSLLPLLRLHSSQLFTPAGGGVIAGVVLVIIGVSICAVAGRRREAVRGAVAGQANSATSKGLLLAILCGFGASFVNFGLTFGQPLLVSALKFGAKSVWAPNAAWLPLMLAGSIPNILYCVYLLSKNKTHRKYSSPSFAGHTLLALLMALFWFGSTVLYGVSAGKLGELGPVLGWPLFMSLIVITASALGILTGEWKNTGKQPLRIQLAGVSFLVAAVFVLALASRWV
ncbi:MAG TPA: L-rhamnose/proton symporter RhaT [Candidatus Saccharimonadales bacterium]|nr:L-rhamnose/proton symporter RhaT [Candidatus Saccharimonadales bacterium]